MIMTIGVLVVAAAAHFGDEVDAAQLGHALIDDDRARHSFCTEPVQRFFRRGEADGFGLRNLRDDFGENSVRFVWTSSTTRT